MNAEDPNNGFAPSPGKLARIRLPGGFGVRIDTHIEAGYAIPPFYDSMIGKLICWGRDRDEAIERMLRVLDELVVESVTTTAAFHARLLNHPNFRSGDFNTAFVAGVLEGQSITTENV
ncbi:hypothetical protein [Rhizobium lusitanum]|uniref:hypothetical protein n=1 Tax=Rhizobium lusitanum TaxID=293958 RepID=UPI0032B123CE